MRRVILLSVGSLVFLGVVWVVRCLRRKRFYDDLTEQEKARFRLASTIDRRD